MGKWQWIEKIVEKTRLKKIWIYLGYITYWLLTLQVTLDAALDKDSAKT